MEMNEIGTGSRVLWTMLVTAVACAVIALATLL